MQEFRNARSEEQKSRRRYELKGFSLDTSAMRNVGVGSNGVSVIFLCIYIPDVWSEVLRATVAWSIGVSERGLKCS